MTSVPDRSASCDAASGPCPAARGACVRASRIAFEGADAALVAGAAGLDPLANPDLFLGEPLVEERVLPRLGGEDLLPALEERRVVAGPVVEPAAVELDDPGGQPFEEDAVVGDEDERARRSGAGSLRASGSRRCRGGSSARRAGGCRARRRAPGRAGRAASCPRRASSNAGVGVEPHPGEDGSTRWSLASAGAVVGRAPRRPRRRRCRLRPRGPPGQPGDPQPLLADDLALVGLDLAVDQAEERALPLAVAAEQADPLAALDSGNRRRPAAAGRRTPG